MLSKEEVITRLKARAAEFPSQADYVAYLNESQPSVSSALNGHRSPTAKMLADIGVQRKRVQVNKVEMRYCILN
jgi:hypothetical protein